MYAQRTMQEAVVQTSDKLNTQIATGEMWLLQQEIMNMCCDVPLFASQQYGDEIKQPHLSKTAWSVILFNLTGNK